MDLLFCTKSIWHKKEKQETDVTNAYVSDYLNRDTVSKVLIIYNQKATKNNSVIPEVGAPLAPYLIYDTIKLL